MEHLTDFHKKFPKHSNIQKVHKNPLEYRDTNTERKFARSHSWRFIWNFLTQIKLKLSPLKSHLFNYNSTDNPFCPACKDSIETPLHFFTECIAYRTHRHTMLTNLLKLNPKISSLSEFLDFIVNGSETGSQDHRVQINKSIFRHVSIFMFKTKRFTTIDWMNWNHAFAPLQFLIARWYSFLQIRTSQNIV